MDLGLVFAIGVLGSAHCVGMCGGFVLALSGLHGGARARHVHGALYALGKTATYALFGAVAGGLGGAAMQLFAPVQDVLSAVLGVALVVVGLGLLGVRRRVGGAGWIARLDVVGRMLRYAASRRAHAASFGLGLVNGLLPCGLVYGLLLKAATTGSALGGALTMAVFGLATLPALYALALSGHLLRPAWRTRLSAAGGALVVVLGLLTFVRGTPVLDALMDGHAGHAPTEQTAEPAPADANGGSPHAGPAHAGHR